MIEYLTIIAITLAQIGLYIWMDRRLYILSKISVLLGLLAAQLFIFPRLIILIYGYNNQECGMSIVALHLFFLILGGGLNMIAHLTYYFIKRKTIKQKL